MFLKYSELLQRKLFKEELLRVSTSNIGQVAPIKTTYIGITINPGQNIFLKI